MDKSLKPASNKACINETSRRCRQILDDKFSYLDAMQKSPVDSAPIKNLVQSAFTDKIADREIFMKGIGYSYYYEE